MAGDFNPLHVDRAHAAGSHFGAVVAHAGLVASAAIGLGSMDAPVPATVGLLEMNWKFLHPVRAGDSIRSRWRLSRKRPLEGRAWGVAVWQVEVENQDGVKVAEGLITRLVATKASSGTAAVEERLEEAGPSAATPARRRRRRGRGGSHGIGEAVDTVLEEPEPEPENADVPSPARRTRRRRGGQLESAAKAPPPAEPAPESAQAPASAAGTGSRRRRRRRSGGGNGANGGETAPAASSEPGPAPAAPTPAAPADNPGPAARGRRSGGGRLGSVLRRLRGGD